MGDSMKYFKDGDILLSDFDGVFLDSQKKFDEVMQEEKSLEKWMDFLNGINWKTFIRECDFVPDALETFTELQKLKVLRGFITRIHSFDEGKEKCLFIRELGFYIPIYYALIDQPKNLIYTPNRQVILLDDDEKNCTEWEENQGLSILYNPVEKPTTKKYVKSLKDLLK